VLSKYEPPVLSPPIAYSLLPSYASPKSALAGVNAGPVSHEFVAMLKRSVVVEFASGLGWSSESTSSAEVPPNGASPKPPAM
jgi:hypothetical protein